MYFRDGLKLKLPAAPRLQMSFLVFLVSLILPIFSSAQGTGYNLGNLGVFDKWSKVEVGFTGPYMDGLNDDSADNDVGNGWVEVESSDSTTGVSGGKLVFDAADDSFRPLIYRSFALQDKGVMTWSFDLNFQRTGSERIYSFWMQLGQGSLMSDSNPREAGVAVNLKWGGPSNGLDTHEGLGYVLDGQVNQIAKVRGNKAVRVAVDLDHLTYSVIVGSQQVLEVPFDNVVAIDTVRFFAHQLNQANFGSREIDNLVLAAGESAPNKTLVADDFERGYSETNPFKIDVNVSFTGPGGIIYVVPAFYEGDGNGGLQGDRWKVRFSPDRTGLWSFLSSSGNSQLDGYSGHFSVVSPPPEAEPFVKWGRLKHVGEHYLKFADGPYWLKGGADDPEDFLAPGVMGNWSQKKAAVDYLADKGINSMYIMLQNVDGDGDNVWPWASRKGSEHFDVARLAQWGDLFDYIQSKGIVLHLVLEDDSGWTGFNRYLYYREMIARFGHYNGLYWNISEEFGENYSADEVKSFAQMVRDIDPYGHPIAVHNVEGLNHWADFLGDSHFDITSFQTGKTPQNAATIEWRDATSAAGHPIAISFDETGETSPADRTLARQIVWSIYMGGGNFELHTSPIETFQEFEDHWNDLRRARLFIENLPFWEMGPWNDLLVGGTGNHYCLAKDGEIYAVYLASGGAISLDLTGVANSYQVTWFNPVTGKFSDGVVIAGGGVRSLGSPPFGGDAAAMVKRTGPNPNQSPLAYDFTISTSMSGSVGISLTPYILDGDGPGPYKFTILEQPSHGTLVGGGSEWTYSPEPGFSGQDTFTWRCNDGLDDSNVATATIVVNSEPDTNNGLLTEDFEKSDSATVGNGWVEVESGVSKTRVAGGKLVFDAVDDAFRPLIYHGFPLQQTGVMTWSFDLNFQRTGRERVYSFWMQLGQRSLMSDADPRDAGVAVNLKWGGPSNGLDTHAGLGYVLDGQVHQFAIVKGIETVTVVVDLDQQLYSVTVGQQQAPEVPFDNSVSIDTVRFFAHELNRSNFAFRELDNVILQ